MKKLLLIANVVAIAALSYGWYRGELVPAWLALIWCFSSAIHDLEDYLKSRRND